MKKLKILNSYYSTLGFRGLIVFIISKLLRTQPILAKKLPGFNHPVYLRIGTTDTSVFRQVFIEKHYDIPLQKTPKVIIDAGANIGLSAVYFASRFPDTIIIALEPEESNFEILRMNASPYPQIRPLKSALWKEDMNIFLIDPGDGHHGFRTAGKSSEEGVHKEPGGCVQGTTVNSLLEKYQLEFCDILKIDIEGSEKEVLECSQTWIDKVGVIMVELHDHIKDGCSEAFREASRDFHRHFSKGEIAIAMKNVE